MQQLYVLYDTRCGLCTWLKAWLMEQPACIRLRLVPAESAERRRLFPHLKKEPQDLVVISGRGEIWKDDRAWIMVLYSLCEYREWARRLAHPLLMPLARQAFAAISRNRFAVSRFMGLRREAMIAEELSRWELPACGWDRES